MLVGYKAAVLIFISKACNYSVKVPVCLAKIRLGLSSHFFSEVFCLYTQPTVTAHIATHSLEGTWISHRIALE